MRGAVRHSLFWLVAANAVGVWLGRVLVWPAVGDLAGRNITVSWAYSPSYAKPLSVPQGLITLLTRVDCLTPT